MKDLYRNPIFYYIAVPVILAFWPLLIWGLYLPNAQSSWQNEKDQYNKAQKIIKDLLNADPDRLDFADVKANAAEFDYATAVDKIASLCKIPSANYRMSSGIIMTADGKPKSQSANVTLKQVDMAKFARFLSTIQLRWSNLQCSKLKLTKKKGLTDTWDADLEFKYYY